MPVSSPRMSNVEKMRREEEKTMAKSSGHGRAVAGLVAISLAFSFMAGLPSVHAQDGNKLLGGPRGMVKSAKGDLLEGIMVQLIAGKNAIRTTVYSNAEGRYEFPKLDAGTYTLRIARPLECRPFVKEAGESNGAT